MTLHPPRLVHIIRIAMRGIVLIAASCLAASACRFNPLGAGPADVGGPAPAHDATTTAPDAEPDAGTVIAPDADLADTGTIAIDAGTLADAGSTDAANADTAAPDGAPEDAAPFDGGALDAAVVFPYNAANFDEVAEAPNALVDWTLNGHCNLDSTNGTFNSQCGTRPASRVLNQSNGDALLIIVRSFTIPSTAVLTISGDKPVIIGVYGDATLDGELAASASGTNGGPGAAMSGSCMSSGEGAEPQDSESRSGGGGGAFGFNGGDGGGMMPGRGGGINGSDDLIPLRAGCRGGRGGGGDVSGGGDRGAAGGGVQISAEGTLSLGGNVHASGGGGGGGFNQEGGGGGGGSGGAILLEANALELGVDAIVVANGGAGGQGAAMNGDGNSGEDGSRISESRAVCIGSPNAGGVGGTGGTRVDPAGPGTPPPSGDGGFGGGGGAAGRIRLNGITCARDPLSIVSPDATFGMQICP